MVGDTGEALVYGIPAGEVKLSETVVPFGYVHMPPILVTVKEEHTSENQLKVTAVNDVIVKLGNGSDWWVLPTAISLIVLTITMGVVSLLFLRKKKKP